MTTPRRTPGAYNGQPRNGQPRLRGQARADLAAQLAVRYDGGESILALAASTGRSYWLMRALLLEAGVSLRQWGGPRVARGRLARTETRTREDGR